MQLYDYIIYPLECIYKIFYLFFNEYTHSYGIALILLSMFTYLVTYPLMRWASGLSKNEKDVQRYITPQLQKIKAELKGAEQHRAIQRLYKRYGYHPVMSIRSAIGVLMQLPFLMAAYYMLSNLQDIRGVEWFIFKNLGKPDALLGTINVMPFVMTGVNLLSAYMTPGFGRKERIQAFVIAVLFLVLLYNAPCALLIYWTFNNFWTLLYNVATYLSLKDALSKIIFYSEFVRRRSKSTYDYRYICLSLAFTGAFAVPLDIFLNNAGEFWFNINQVIPWFVIWTVAAYVVFVSIYFIANCRFRKYYLLLLVGVLVGLVLQSYFVSLDYGVLNGESIDWSKYRVQGIINTIVWLICIISPVIMAKFLGINTLLKKVNKLCLILILSQIISLSYSYFKIPDVQKNTDVPEYDYVLTSDKMFELSSKENMIVFVLDCFDNTIFDEILKSNPWVKDELAGFTYYANATSVHGGTDTSLPQILTGIKFENNMTVKQYVNDAWLKTEFFNVLNKMKYDSRLFTYNSFVSPSTANIDNLKKVKLVNRVGKNVLKKYIKLSLFREVPHILKKNFVVYSDDITKHPNKVVDKRIRPYVQNDLNFFKTLKKGITINDDTNAFRLYHLRGPHPPHRYDENIEKVQQSSYYKQGLGSLKIVFEYLRQLKDKKIFDNTIVAIIADHGFWDSIAHGPIVCFKKYYSSTSSLNVSDNPVSLDDLHSSFMEKYMGENTIYNHPFWSKQKGDKRYVYYRGKNLSLNEWVVDGDMKDKKAWRLNRTIEFNSELSQTYNVGSTVKFGSLGNGVNYLKSGWRALDIGGAYSDRNKVPCLEFKLNQNKRKDMVMSIKFNVSDKGIKDDSKVNLVINDSFTKVSDIKSGRNDVYVKIPKEHIVENKINIKFKLSNTYVVQVLQANFDWVND